MFAYPMNITVGQLKDLLSNLESRFGQVLLENVTNICFPAINRLPDNFNFHDDFDLSIWEKGRAFGEQMELRWRRRRENYAVLLISDFPLSSIAIETEKLPEAKSLERVESFQIILWGEWQNPKEETEMPDLSRPYWYEESIPKFLAYPWDGCDKRLAIEVFKYRVLPQNPQEEHNFPGDFIYRFVRLIAVGSGADTETEEKND